MNLKIFTATLAVLGATAGAQAATFTPALVYGEDAGTQNLVNGPYTLGYEISINKSVTVDALGFLDAGSDGLAESHDVGLWDSSGNLLALGTVAAGTGATLVNNFRYVSVAPVTLTAGSDYFVGALYIDGADGVLFPGYGGTFSTDSRVNYIQATYGDNSTPISDPTTAFGTNGFFGPNLGLAVPEPSAWALMLVGFAGMGAALRSRRGVITV